MSLVKNLYVASGSNVDFRSEVSVQKVSSNILSTSGNTTTIDGVDQIDLASSSSTRLSVNDNGMLFSSVTAPSSIAAGKFGLYLKSGTADKLYGMGENDTEVEITNQAPKYKEPVRVATTEAGTLASSFENSDTVDGITLATNDRILIKDQVDASENGVYVVQASGAPTRSIDFDNAADFDLGSSVIVFEGTSGAGSSWYTSTKPATVGTNDWAWTQTVSFPSLASTSVRAATTVNGVLATAYENGDSVDGVTLVTNDRILIKDQTTASENGVYIVQASGAPVRASDFDDASDFDLGTQQDVREGTSQAGTSWYVSTKPATVDTNDWIWTQTVSFPTAASGSVRAATTVNGTLATAYENGDSIDGVTLATGDRILLKDQSDAKENGVYVVQASGAPNRSDDFDNSDDFDLGDKVYVTEGTANAQSDWYVSTKPATVGSNNWDWTEIVGGDVVGPGSSTDEGIARFDSTTGKLIQDSSITINDSGSRITFTNANGALYSNTSNERLRIDGTQTALFGPDGTSQCFQGLNSTATLMAAGTIVFRGTNSLLELKVNSEQDVLRADASNTRLLTNGTLNLLGDTSGQVMVGANAAPNEVLTVEGVLSLDEQAAPSATGGYGKIYVSSSDNRLHFMDTNGSDTTISPAYAYFEAVRAATTANGTLSTAYENGDTIDGVTLATDDRILIKDQTTTSENGIYIVQASGAPTRASDADAPVEFEVGTRVAVLEGTANADTRWYVSTKPATIGSNPWLWTQTDASGSSGVSGPVSSTDSAVMLWDGTSGDTAKDSSYTINDNLIMSINGVKHHAPVRCVYEHRITATGLQANVRAGLVVDGITLAVGDRVLCNAEDRNPQYNGIYTVNSGANPTRATDWDDAADFDDNAFVHVLEGHEHSGSTWRLLHPPAVVTDTFDNTGNNACYWGKVRAPGDVVRVKVAIRSGGFGKDANDTLGGYAMDYGDRFLVFGENNLKNNGIFVITEQLDDSHRWSEMTRGATSALDADFDVPLNYVGMEVYVEEGEFAGQMFRCITSPETIDDDPFEWQLISDWKNRIHVVKYATTANINLSTNNLTAVDTGSITNDDLILVKDQSTASENGIYRARNGVTWVRAYEWDNSDEFEEGIKVYVDAGSTNAQTEWYTSTKPATVGTNDWDWSKLEVDVTIIPHETSASTSQTLDATNKFIEFSSTSATTVTLPDTATIGAGKKYIIAKSGTGSAVTINCAGSNTFNDLSTSQVLNNQWDIITILTNGGSGASGIWYII